MLELFAPRRVAIPDLRPRRHRAVCGSGLRYSRRTRKLTPAEESAIRALAATKSLRSLAADFEVSHETIRAVLCRRVLLQQPLAEGGTSRGGPGSHPELT